MDKTAVSAPMVADLAVLRAENKSAQTIAAYNYAVTGLAEFLTDRGMPTAISAIAREHIEAFLVDLLERRSPATANNRYRGLVQFFRWAVEEGEIQTSPMAHISPPKIPEREVAVLTDDELRALLATCDPKTFEGRRDEAILRVFMDSGLRLPRSRTCAPPARTAPT